MRVGFIGLGRLGLPIAAVLSQHHQVTGYDPDPSTAQRLIDGHPWEVGLEEYLGKITFADDVTKATYDADVVVVCVQTPHGEGLDGTRATWRREPFNLGYVTKALASLETDAPVVLMSTVLPGDCRRLSRFISGELIYAPAFPAMGTTIADVLDPEFLLAGAESDPEVLWDLWQPVLPQWPPSHWQNWETAELTKMLYNTFIGFKLALANTASWLATEVGADGGEVMRILSNAHRRITSPAYLKPGLGDGGACHPRDQLALSWLADKHEVFNIFDAIIDQRLAHSEWIAQVTRQHANGMDVVILGSAYKAESVLTDGSPALLLSNQTGWPVVESPPTEPHCIVIGVPHTRYQSLDLSQHRVIDPWGIVAGSIQLGRGKYYSDLPSRSRDQ